LPGQLERALGLFARLTSRFRVWYRLPFVFAIPTLLGLRVNMRQQNLFDTERDPSLLVPGSDADQRDIRQADGSYNDLGCPWMGMANARFGRNVPIAETFGETEPGVYRPNPRLISRKLLARRTFVPVPHLNVLAAAWLQFMVHDWLSHGSGDRNAEPYKLPLDDDDDWGGSEMTILRTSPDTLMCTADQSQPAAFRNRETHWWDASQIYGSSRERQHLVRTNPATQTLRDDGKLQLADDGHLPIDTASKIANLELSGVNGSWWIGLSVLHTIFAREHNAIVDRLRIEYPDRSGEWLFQKARLVNAALLAKIHTTEWTPALMNSPEGRFALRGNWWGALGEHHARAFDRLGDGEVLSGIPGSTTDHHTAPYAITEEFVAVYRMHSLIPDDFSFRRHDTDEQILSCDFGTVTSGGAARLYAKVDFADAVYSLATEHPGALVLHNYPVGLRKLSKDDQHGVFSDIAAIDILRDRERGVPRYCAFRRHLGMRAPRTFAQLTSNKDWQRELKEVYESVEDVDLLVGMHCETAPPGFGFSDTAFRIFILLASRRLKSDRFFTIDFTPKVYTPAGFDWIRDNSFRSVLERHLPALSPHFADIRNVFFPWDRLRS
jgi:hypothetical protein